MRIKKVGIVGGGPGGLFSAYFLEKIVNAPIHITLFEASERLGGKILTPTFSMAPVSYEAGAAEFYDYSHFDEDPLKELIHELGLSIQPMGGSSVIMDDQLLSSMADIKNHFGDAAVEALQAFDRRARNKITPSEFYHSDHPEGISPSVERDSFAKMFEQIEDANTRRFVETLIHSDLATEPRCTNTSYGLQNCLMNDCDYMTLYGIVGGNEQLPRELIARIHAELNTGHRVNEIARSGDQIRIQTNSGSLIEDHEFDYVIVALPHVAIPSVEFQGQELGEAIARHHEHYNHPAHYLRVSMLFDRQFWKPALNDSYWMLDKFDGCCLYDESSRQPGTQHGVLGWLLGGETALEMCEMSDDELIEAALASLPPFLSEARKCFLEGRVHRWASAVSALPGGIGKKNEAERHQPEPVHHPNLFMVGDYLYDTTLNGVLDSAYCVATWIAANLNNQTVIDAHRQQSPVLETAGSLQNVSN